MSFKSVAFRDAYEVCYTTLTINGVKFPFLQLGFCTQEVDFEHYILNSMMGLCTLL